MKKHKNKILIKIIRSFATSVGQSIVNIGKWLGSPANIKGSNKEAKIEVGRSMTVHIFCFAFIHYA